ncbi:MAG: hypothetical protein KKF52_01130, partial [Nanoarchaeota archaeon]|nr:hypothetical protein [Nanoarchaeota archaeon]
LDNNATGKKYIVLLTDGENNEGKSPEEIFRMINESNEKTGDFKTQLYIIAFDTDKNNFKGLEKLGANVSEAKSVEALVKEMNKNTNLILEKMPE